MRVRSQVARGLLWLSLLWGAGPMVGVGIAEAVMRFGIFALPVIGFGSAIVAAVVAEIVHRRRRPAPEGEAA